MRHQLRGGEEVHARLQQLGHVRPRRCRYRVCGPRPVSPVFTRQGATRSEPWAGLGETRIMLKKLINLRQAVVGAALRLLRKETEMIDPRLRTRVVGMLLLSGVWMACSSEANDPGTEEVPPPYASADELSLGEAHTFGAGHRVAVHDLAHRQTGTSGDEEVTGLAAEVEMCAGEDSLEVNPFAMRLFTETPFDMQGTPTVMHGRSGAAMTGLKEPLLEQNQTLSAGECARGWVDFFNVYDDHGTPTRVGFVASGTDEAAAVWPASEG